MLSLSEKIKKPARYIDTSQYLDMVTELVREGKEAAIPISGNSMSPFLVHERDEVMLGAVQGNLKSGDIVLYKRGSGQYVLHRIIKRKTDGFYMAGDAQDVLEGPIGRDQIVAWTKRIRRKGEWRKEKDLCSLFFAYIWVRAFWGRKYAFFVWRFFKKHLSDR